MTPAQRRYFAVEMVIAAVINAVLSFAFVFLVFGSHARVPLADWSGVAGDALPQSFMVALMSWLVPTFLTRRRLVAGKVATMAPALRLPIPLLARPVLVAGGIAILAVLLHLLFLPLLGQSWAFAAVLTYKCLYGALLGATVAALAIRVALGEG